MSDTSQAASIEPELGSERQGETQAPSARQRRSLFSRILPPALIGQPRLVYAALFFVTTGALASILAPATAGLPAVFLLGGVLVLSVMALLRFALTGGELRDRELALSLASDKERQRLLLSAVPERSQIPCLITGLEGEAIYANRAYARLFGLVPGAAAPLDLLCRDDRDMAAALFRLIRNAREETRIAEDVALSSSMRKKLKLVDPATEYLRLEARKLVNGEAQILWEIHEISAPSGSGLLSGLGGSGKAPSEAAIALNDLPGGAVIFNGKGQMVLANDRMATWLGMDERPRTDTFDKEPMPDPDDAAGSGFLSEDIIPYEALGDLAPGATVSFTAKLRLTDGTERPTEWLVRPLPSKANGGDKGEPRFLAVVTELGSVSPLKEDQSRFEVTDPIEQLWWAGGFEEAPLGVAVADFEGKIERANGAFLDLVSERGRGVTAGNLGRLRNLFEVDDRSSLDQRLKHLSEGRSEGRAEEDANQDMPAGIGDEVTERALELRFSESQRSGQVYLRRLNRAGLDDRLLIYLVDTTQQKLLELQFAQAQKMQGVGQLAGGVAHDFNNLLTAIIGYCDLLLVNHKVGDPSFADINLIKQNANRAANLVRQLLAFSRRQTLVPVVLSLTDALSELKALLSRLIGERIDLSMIHARDLGLVRVDQVQMEQVIINLAVNARDAMAEGGKLTIRTANVAAKDVPTLGQPTMDAIDYVSIEVTDTGHGMSREVMAKVFEPFFTTKAVGEGTGLGLSTVYGIIKQTGGYIFVESAVGQGTTFRIYLPRHFESAEDRAQREAKEKAPPTDLTGAETILLVEDEDGVRSVAARTLETRGYQVLSADNGETALELLETHGEPVDLIVTDVVMPAMDGPTMVKEIRARFPQTRVIFMSGYAEDAFGEGADRPSDFVFLPKPFTLQKLAKTVKDVLQRA